MPASGERRFEVGRRLAIVGAGGHGRVVADAAELLGWDVAFFDDHAKGDIAGWQMVGPVSLLFETLRQVDGVIVAIGNNRVRLELVRRLAEAGANVETIVHPSAVVSSRASLGPGTVLAGGAVVNIGVQLGVATIVNTGATIDHDCTIADGVHFSPGVHISGTVSVGEASWLGTGSSVRNNLSIGRDVVVGVGAAVVASVPDNVIVHGVPARVMR